MFFFVISHSKHLLRAFAKRASHLPFLTNGLVRQFIFHLPHRWYIPANETSDGMSLDNWSFSWSVTQDQCEKSDFTCRRNQKSSFQSQNARTLTVKCMPKKHWKSSISHQHVVYCSKFLGWCQLAAPPVFGAAHGRGRGGGSSDGAWDARGCSLLAREEHTPCKSFKNVPRSASLAADVLNKSSIKLVQLCSTHCVKIVKGFCARNPQDSKLLEALPSTPCKPPHALSCWSEERKLPRWLGNCFCGEETETTLVVWKFHSFGAPSNQSTCYQLCMTFTLQDSLASAVEYPVSAQRAGGQSGGIL